MEAVASLLLQRLSVPGSVLQQHGASFRDLLQPHDVATLRSAQQLFHASIWVPAILYYVCRLSDDPPRFPCTISWSIRRAAPRHTQHALWLAGWWQVCRVVLAQGDVVGTAFASSMVLTGVVAVMLCPVGISPFFDAVHYVAAGIYMVDHFVLLSFFGVTAVYCYGFGLSIALFLLSTTHLHRLHSEIGAHFPADIAMEGRRQVVQALPPQSLRRLFQAELAEMVFEYAMFIIFISGMCTGIDDVAGGSAPVPSSTISGAREA